ncbi:hypothetical protein QRX60_28570 [Amycolatopsis mongoliensis]|uniref:AMIN-like domain-containing protein n=1 Tax=Amycolatopsis mongoliensis TaxID=715475 RepID=A0A9Y2JH90_9PSEU|nr:hypothetical protein [Amycolatopsis sp. 4-36]WIX98027.1 hypothetical protein QRX60_28570 [Amycolatopsis sp. 4-36]
MRLLPLFAVPTALSCGLLAFAQPTPGAPRSRSTTQDQATLVAVRAAHHADFDRVVFEFDGPLPAERDVRYVPEVIGDPSGNPVPLVGDAFLNVRMAFATGHDDSGDTTYGAPRRTYPLPNVIQVVNAGDFEGVLNFGIGVARQSPVRLSVLTGPSRVVIDIDTPFRTVPAQAFFLDVARFEAATEPYTRAVSRPVIPPATAHGALQRLFAGPTESELAQRLAFVDSDATGFTGLAIVDSIARVRLTGGCSSHGSTFSIAEEITRTLKQFPSVHWVKIYDPAGHTERPDGAVDSIPECLEP